MSTDLEARVTPEQLQDLLPKSVLSLRGYNQTNLGRTTELLSHPKYEPIVAEYLDRASRVCGEVTGKSISLVDRVRRNEETSLNSYADAVALIVAVEMAQLKLLEQFFKINYRKCMLSFGFSLGEIAAVVAGGILEMEDALRIPLALSADCVALADNVSLAVVFSREEKIPFEEIQRMCLLISGEGKGAIGISTMLAPNSLLVLGQGFTMDRLREMIHGQFPKKVFLRVNQGDWPPLHTCIMWQKAIPNRAAVLMQTTKFNLEKPTPPILSLVTGKISYDKLNALDLIHKWVDHTQRLWDAINESLVMGVETFIHVGPEPNIVPATLKRLKDNIEGQARASFGMRALSAAAQRRWLQSILPQRTALLRATTVRQINLEDWLLEQKDF
ncbi:MAG: hypothetical protein U0930_01350 [Pirellulales bacterium]